jgi:rhamnose transport system substrate-binding protein
VKEIIEMARKLINILLLCGLTLALSLAAVTVHAQDRWVGGDNLPTQPLDCPEGVTAVVSPDATPEASMEAPKYDGGVPTGAPDLKGKPIVLVDVPKLIGIGYFNATSAGIQEAAKELGNVTVTTDGPTEGDITKQVATIEQYVQKGVNGILFAANDPVGISPVLKEALSKGIHVVGYDANSQPDAREWFVNQAPFNQIAKAKADAMHAEIGDEGAFAIVTSSFTAPNQGRWIAEMQDYMAKCYPKMKWLETVESQEDQNQAFQQTQTLINKYGPDMDGVFGMSSVAFPGAADAVAQAKLCPTDAAADFKAPDDASAVHVVGLSTPNQMKEFVTGTKAGCVKSVVLWNPVDLGYAAVYVMRAVVDGDLTATSTTVKAGRLGDLSIINGSEILLGAPFIFTKDNIDKFDF